MAVEKVQPGHSAVEGSSEAIITVDSSTTNTILEILEYKRTSVGSVQKVSQLVFNRSN